jgi:hypothetical protein
MLRSVRKKLLKYCQRILVALLWAKEYSQTVCPQGVYMFLIRKERLRMDDNMDWLRWIVPESQIESMRENFEKIAYRMSGGVNVVLTADNQSAVELCQNWRKALQGDSYAWIKMSAFMDGIASTVAEHLMEEGIDPYDEL